MTRAKRTITLPARYSTPPPTTSIKHEQEDAKPVLNDSKRKHLFLESDGSDYEHDHDDSEAEEEEDYKPEQSPSRSTAPGKNKRAKTSPAEARAQPAAPAAPAGQLNDEDRAVLAQMEPMVVPASAVQGREVIWDRAIKTIHTGKAKSLYRLDDSFLYSLDRETTRNGRGYKMYLYSEFQVQQAAYKMRGGQEHFRAYIERLRGTALVKATNSGKKPPKPLDLKKAPLKPVPFKKANAGKNWVDNTLIKPQSSMLKSAFGLEDDEWY